MVFGKCGRAAQIVAAAAALLAVGGQAVAQPARAVSVPSATANAAVVRLRAMDAASDPAPFIALAAANLEAARGARGASAAAIAARQVDLAEGLAAAERYDEAEAQLSAAVPVLKAAGPAWQHDALLALNGTGAVLLARGKPGEALPLLAEAVAGLRALSAPAATLDLATALGNLAQARTQAGALVQAQADVEEALRLLRSLRPLPARIAMVEATRVDILSTAGKTAEALEAARTAIVEAEGLLAPDHPLIANLYANRATLLVQQGRAAEALQVARRAFESLEAARGGPTATSALMRAIAGTALIQGGRFAEAGPFLEQALPIMDAKLGEAHPQTLQVREIYARVLQRLGRGAEAVVIQGNLIAIRDRILPRLHADRMTGRVNLAVIAMRNRDFATATRAMDEGLALRAEAVPPAHPEYLAERALALHIKALDGKGSADLAAQTRPVFESLRTIMDLDLEAPIPNGAHAGMLYAGEAAFRSGDRDGAFRAQQWTARTSVDDAVALSRFTRAFQQRPQAGGTLAARKQLVVDRAAVLAVFDAQLRDPAAQFDSAGQGARLDAINRQLAQATAELTAEGVPLRRFSDVGIAEVQQRIGRHDLFLMASRMTDRFLITATTRRKSWQYVTRKNSLEIDVLARTVRSSLDSSGGEVAFARAEAEALFAELFSADVQTELRKARRLLISTNGRMASLPFAVMPDRVGGSGFLADRLAVVRLPGVPQAASADAGAPRGARSFIGLGDASAPGQASGNAQAGPARRGADALVKLPRLPAAAAELQDIARAVGDGAPTILTGEAATEAALRQLSLPRGSVLAFATHGLVSGEIPGLREPALVLSVADPDDGLLTTSEIARLDLPASWVVLSACNTAAGSGPDAPSLSGLAQAFMLAGADRLLATHWPVRDDIARALTGATLRHATAGVEPAEALRRAMADLRRSSLPGAANPALWSAFELVSP